MYEYKAKVIKIYDGDTITVDIDCGFNLWKKKEKLRLANINAPEVRGKEKKEGIKSRDWVRGKLPLGSDITIRTEKDKKGKYGRYIATIFYDVEDDKHRCLNVDIVVEGFAELKDY